MVHAALLLLMLEAVTTRTSLNHQPEAQHPKSSAIHKLAGRLPHLMEWSGRAPAPPAIEAGKGRQRQGASHVSAYQRHDRRNWHRYWQELIPRRRTGCT